MSQNDIYQQEPAPILEPKPLAQRSPSYTEKFELRKHRGSGSLEPPEPVKTPTLDASSQKPYLQRSSTSNYQSTLSQKVPHKASLENAVSANDAYYLKQRNRDIFDNPSVDKLALNDKVGQSQDTAEPVHSTKDAEIHTGLLRHPPSFDFANNAGVNKNYKFSPNSAKGKQVEEPNPGSSSTINDVNAFKRRFSWWSKD